MYPEPELWHKNALKDAGYLAELYQLEFPMAAFSQPTTATYALTHQLLSIQSHSDFVAKALPLLAKYWRGELVSQENKTQSALLEKNNAQLRSKGHYLSSTISYAGEWYWGLDRLDHLENRLNKLNAFKSKKRIKYNETSRHFCQRMSNLDKFDARPDDVLTIFFSARSPYSYLGLERAIRLAKHYRIRFQIKPVLPMMMRGMQVPPQKKWYIFFDTKREARKFGLDYGFVADPLGLGVERCYSLLGYATSEGKDANFLLSYARAVNAQGIRSETDSGLRKIVEKSALSWKHAKSLLGNQEWRDWANNNYDEMHALGLWGVPCFQFQNTSVWGQDRLDILELAICDAIKKANSSINN